MSHWPHKIQREDGDGHAEETEKVFDARCWLRSVADRSRSPMIREMMGDLRRLELASEPFFLGLDYDDEDRDDVDDVGPY